jgi:hypothetical protein
MLNYQVHPWSYHEASIFTHGDQFPVVALQPSGVVVGVV